MVLALLPDAPRVLHGLIQAADHACFPVLTATSTSSCDRRTSSHRKHRADGARRLATAKACRPLPDPCRLCDDLSDRLATIGRGWVEFWSSSWASARRSGSLDAPAGSARDDDEVRSIRIGGHLAATRTRAAHRDAGLFQHVAGIAALELEKRPRPRQAARIRADALRRCWTAGSHSPRSCRDARTSPRRTRSFWPAGPRVIVRCGTKHVHHRAALGVMNPYIGAARKGLSAIIRSGPISSSPWPINVHGIRGRHQYLLVPSSNVAGAPRRASLPRVVRLNRGHATAGKER